MMAFISCQKALWISANEIKLEVTFRILRTEWINIWTSRFPLFFSTKEKWHPPRKPLRRYKLTSRMMGGSDRGKPPFPFTSCSQTKCCTNRSSISNTGHKADKKYSLSRSLLVWLISVQWTKSCLDSVALTKPGCWELMGSLICRHSVDQCCFHTCGTKTGNTYQIAGKFEDLAATPYNLV